MPLPLPPFGSCGIPIPLPWVAMPAALQRPGMAWRIELPEGCGKVAHHAPWKISPSGLSGICQVRKVAHVRCASACVVIIVAMSSLSWLVLRPSRLACNDARNPDPPPAHCAQADYAAQRASDGEAATLAENAEERSGD